MKKISLLILLALCVTVGGVYASWTYAEVATDVKTNTETALKVTDPITNTARGVIDIHNTLSLAIDDNSGNYKPEWDDAVTSANGGNVIINFTPNPGINPGTDGKIIIKYSFAISEGNSYTAHDGETYPIFNYTAPGTDATVFIEKEVEVSATEKTSITITFDEVIAALNVNGEFTVPTYEDYQDYVTAVNATKLTLTVTEVTD